MNTSTAPNTPPIPRPFVFDFDEFPVRVIEQDDGQAWFVAADVCRALDIVNTSDAVSRLDDDEKGIGTTDTFGNAHEKLIISESGLYALIFTSRKEEAKRFRKWVTSEVLPAIRRTGRYSTTQPEAAPLPETEALQSSLAELASKVDRLTTTLTTLPTPRARQAALRQAADAGRVISSDEEKVITILTWLAEQISQTPPDQRPPYKLQDGFLVLYLKATTAFLAKHRVFPFEVHSSRGFVTLLTRTNFLAQRGIARWIDGKKYQCITIPHLKLVEAGITWPSPEWTPNKARRGYRH